MEGLLVLRHSTVHLGTGYPGVEQGVSAEAAKGDTGWSGGTMPKKVFCVTFRSLDFIL